jgi:hypothetical protein
MINNYEFIGYLNIISIYYLKEMFLFYNLLNDNMCYIMLLIYLLNICDISSNYLILSNLIT